MPQARHALSFRPGTPNCEIDAAGLAGRVERGSVGLDGPATLGDIIGSEAMLFGTHAFAASALTKCELAHGRKVP